jgi:hypothetical protein
MYSYCYVYVSTLTKVFLCFSSVVRQMPGYISQRWARSTLFLISELCCSVYCLRILCCSTWYLLFVCKCVLYYCDCVLTQLQLNISHIISYAMIPITSTFFNKTFMWPGNGITVTNFWTTTTFLVRNKTTIFGATVINKNYPAWSKFY